MFELVSGVEDGCLGYMVRSGRTPSPGRIIGSRCGPSVVEEPFMELVDKSVCSVSFIGSGCSRKRVIPD